MIFTTLYLLKVVYWLKIFSRCLVFLEMLCLESWNKFGQQGCHHLSKIRKWKLMKCIFFNPILPGWVCFWSSCQSCLWEVVQMDCKSHQPLSGPYQTHRCIIYRNSGYCWIWNIQGEILNRLVKWLGDSSVHLEVKNHYYFHKYCFA